MLCEIKIREISRIQILKMGKSWIHLIILQIMIQDLSTP